MTFVCGVHRAFAANRGGLDPMIGELTPLLSVRWQRVRDDVSQAEVTIGTQECCDLLSDLRTVINELHIVRNDSHVWQGVITRLEYEQDVVRVFAEDMLWPTKRCVIETGYDQSFPNIGNVIDRVNWLLQGCYSRLGDPWNMLSHLHPIHGPDDPKTSRVVKNWQMYTWEDMDKYAEDYGIDYTVINRDIYWFDIQLAWHVLPDLDESHISQFPRIVEYGMQAATRGVVTDGQGYAGVYEAPPDVVTTYGMIDWLITNENDGQQDGPPTTEEIAQWTATAGRNITERHPPPVAVVIPENTTLMPGAPWEVEELVPGAWFRVTTSKLCRTVSEYQRLQEVVVTEEAPDGESVQFTAVSAPSTMIVP